MEVFLDLDGVLANFIGAAFIHHGIPFSTGNWLEQHAGEWDVMPIITRYGISEREFWAPLGREFWAGLSLTAEARGIVALATDASRHPNRLHVLSSPCHTPGCRDGKHDWLLKHFPILAGNLMLVPSNMKARFSGPGKVLVDDSDQNCAQWADRGGVALLVPRPWNALHPMSHDTLRVLAKGFDQLKPEPTTAMDTLDMMTRRKAS